jgi:hypothetical protein
MEALEKIKPLFNSRVDFDYAKENVIYDFIFVIGGCTNCCASHEQYFSKKGAVKMWDESHIGKVSEAIRNIIEN